MAEAAVATAAIELGLTVLRPICEGRRYDLVIDCEPKLLRVQCKMARRTGGVLAVPLQTNRCTPHGYVSTCYTANEIDAVAAYDPEGRSCYLIPSSEAAGRRALYLRLEAPRNNQALKINWAQDFRFATVIGCLSSTPPTTAESR